VSGVPIRRSNVQCAAVSQHFPDFFARACSPAVGLQLSNVTCITKYERCSSGSSRRGGSVRRRPPDRAPVFGPQPCRIMI
jgi:hypothetical protein